MAMPQVMKSESAEFDTAGLRPRLDPIHELVECRGKARIGLALVVPEQVRLADEGGEGGQELVALERGKIDHAELVALADHRELLAAVIDVDALSLGKLVLARAGLERGRDHRPDHARCALDDERNVAVAW